MYGTLATSVFVSELEGCKSMLPPVLSPDVCWDVLLSSISVSEAECSVKGSLKNGHLTWF